MKTSRQPKDFFAGDSFPPRRLHDNILLFGRPEEYKKKVAEYSNKFASEEALRAQEEAAVSSDSESSMSDFSEDEAQVCHHLS